MRIWDPHFHIWDVSSDSPSGHDLAQLFAVDGNPLYGLEQYEADLRSAGFELTGGAFVEAVSVCHVDVDGSKYREACLAEAQWVSRHLANSPLDYVLVGTAPLEDPELPALLDGLSACPEFRGIRQILNYEPSWPRNGSRGDFLDRKDWREGFAVLAKRPISFELQLNPRQFRKAAGVLSRHPGTTVILNHLGSPVASDLERGGERYWDGLKALADLEQVNLKISMLSYADKAWDGNALVRDAVHKAIELFGIRRCMFASNFPVEKAAGWPADKLYAAFSDLAGHLGEQDRQLLFADNARRVYRAGMQ